MSLTVPFSSSSSFYKSLPYIHWIHCNKCYKMYIRKEVRFYVLACRHVLCNSCIIELDQLSNGPRIYECTICKEIARACEINNTMPKQLKNLFHPKPYMDGLDTYNILRFQQAQRQRFMEHMDRLEIQKKLMNQENAEIKETARHLFQYYEEVKAERRHLQYTFKRCHRVNHMGTTTSSSGYSSYGSQ
ncbi:RING finger protein vilya-like [Haematobia irritans]|uniref:RING finger protein vilya-like n=1 Tax=Haematobia irritans TaxID=7368 RepID=UPI003F507E25